MQPDAGAVSRILEEIAAEEVLPRFQQLGRREVKEKRPGELVTAVDLAVERRLEERLTDLLPGSAVLGEEAAEHEPDAFARLAGEAPVWIVDPIDGTGNFARGRPVFALMVALVVRGDTVAGWIHDPVGRRTALAVAGGGARLSGRGIRVPAPPREPDALAGVLHANRYGRPRVVRRVRERRDRLDARKSLHCAGFEYLRLLRGELHFAFFTRLHPWDHAPGSLILAEAGGCARLIDGRPYRPQDHGADGLLVAADEECWRAVYDTLFGDGKAARFSPGDGS